MVFMILFYYRCLECHFCSIPWCCDQGMHIPLVPVRMEAHPGSGPCSHIHEEGGYSSLPEAAYGLTLPTFTRHPRRIPDIEGESQQRAPQSLVGYIDRQWMNHSVFHPSSWTVYRQAVRTNNDVEGDYILQIIFVIIILLFFENEFKHCVLEIYIKVFI